MARPLLHRWKQLLAQGGERAIAADEDVVPVSRLRAAEQRIRDLERALWRQTMAVEILHAAQDEVKKTLVGRVTAMTGCSVVVVCRVLRIGRATAYRGHVGRPASTRNRRTRTGPDSGDHPPARQLRLPAGDGPGEPDLRDRHNRKRIHRMMQLAQLTVRFASDLSRSASDQNASTSGVSRPVRKFSIGSRAAPARSRPAADPSRRTVSRREPR